MTHLHYFACFTTKYVIGARLGKISILLKDRDCNTQYVSMVSLAAIEAIVVRKY